jgi:Uma2 family endonuclease
MAIPQEYLPHYTYEDYAQWEGRWELIEGLPYAMIPAPTPQHQRVQVFLLSAFFTALTNCRECRTYGAPLDWKVTVDTVVQPDIMIVCQPVGAKYLDFPPVAAVEILSPATALKDRHLKFELYQSQGVRYYLIIDPALKQIELYQIRNGKYVQEAVEAGVLHFALHNNCEISIGTSGLWD